MAFVYTYLTIGVELLEGSSDVTCVKYGQMKIVCSVT